MSIEDRQSQVIELFENNRNQLPDEVVYQVEEALDIWSEMYENDIDISTLDDLLIEITNMINEII